MTGQATQTPDSENARRCERRAFSSTATFGQKAVPKLALDPSAIKVTLSDPERVLGLLGLLDGAKRQAHGFMVCCPWHSERTPSCSVKLASDGTIAAHCFGCGAGGDVLSLVAAARGLDARRDFPRVVELAADLAGGSLDGYRPPVRRAMPALRLPPPVESVGALWAAAKPVTDDADLARQLLGRCLDPAIIEDRDLARCLPSSGTLPTWARSGSQTWRKSGHRLLFPLWNAEGSLCSVHARIVDSGQTERAKGMFPASHSAGGLFLADSFALLLIRSGVPKWWRQREPPSVIITEGAPDFLTVATHYGCSEYAPAVLGILSGSWSDELAARIPTECRVIVKVHRDEAGQKYRDQICRSLSGRCRVFVGDREVAHG